MSLVSNHCSSCVINSCRISSYKQHGYKSSSHGKFKVPIKMIRGCSSSEDLDQDVVSLAETVSSRSSFPIVPLVNAIAGNKDTVLCTQYAAMDTSESAAPVSVSGGLTRKIKGRPMKRSKNVRKMKAIAKAISKSEKAVEKVLKGESK